MSAKTDLGVGVISKPSKGKDDLFSIPTINRDVQPKTKWEEFQDLLGPIMLVGVILFGGVTFALVLRSERDKQLELARLEQACAENGYPDTKRILTDVYCVRRLNGNDEIIAAKKFLKK